MSFSTGEGKRADTAQDTCHRARHPLHHGRKCRSEYSTPLKSKSFHCKAVQDPTCKPGGLKPSHGAPQGPPAAHRGSRGPATPPWPPHRGLRAGEGNKAPTGHSAARKPSAGHRICPSLAGWGKSPRPRQPQSSMSRPPSRAPGAFPAPQPPTAAAPTSQALPGRHLKNLHIHRPVYRLHLAQRKVLISHSE